MEEIKEVNEEVVENNNEVEVEQTVSVAEDTKPIKKKRRSIFGILMSIIATLLFLYIVFETVIAFLNFNLIKENKEPEYFVTTTKETKGEYEYTIHDMGLYKIVRKDTAKNFEIKLLPFFMEHE